MQSKKVHLVLGSGGARGIAHIGVIESLEQDGYEIASVTGCSMGAVVGGMYCAGFLTQYKEWLLTLTKARVFSLFDFTLSKAGFVKGERVLSTLRSFTGEQNIEALKIPFTAVATDILHKKEIHFRSGNLYNALRASMGIPGVFTPVQEGDSYLIDGSVLNPLPINLVQRTPGELIIAVNLNGHCQPLAATANQKSSPEEEAGNSWLKSLSIGTKKKNTGMGTPGVSFSMFDLLNLSYDYTQDRLTELMLQCYPPDMLIEIPRNCSSVFEFHRAAELIALGRQAYDLAKTSAVALRV